MSAVMKRFRVALSFAGEKRDYVAEVAARLAARFGRAGVLYDKYHEAEFARRNLGFHLPDLYQHDSDLIVVVVCRNYALKEWCGLEWDAIFALLTQGKNDEIMLCRFDRAMMRGLHSTAGFVELDDKSPDEATACILERLEVNEREPKDHCLSSALSEDSSPTAVVKCLPVRPPSPAESDRIRTARYWLTYPDTQPGKKREIVRQLKQSDEPAARELLIELVHNDDDVADEAVLALLELSDRRVECAVPRLLESLRAASGNRKIMLIEILGKIRVEESVDLLREVALGATTSIERNIVIEALGRIGGEAAARYLLTVVHDGDEGVKGWAIDALGATREQSAIEPLMSIFKDLFERRLKNAEDKSIGVKIVRAIRRIGSTDEIENYWRGILPKIPSADVRNEIEGRPPIDRTVFPRRRGPQ